MDYLNPIDRETEQKLFDKVFTLEKKCNCSDYRPIELSLIDLDTASIITVLLCPRCKKQIGIKKAVLLETVIERLEKQKTVLCTQIDLDRDIETKTKKLFELANLGKMINRFSVMKNEKRFIE